MLVSLLSLARDRCFPVLAADKGEELSYGGCHQTM